MKHRHPLRLSAMILLSLLPALVMAQQSAPVSMKQAPARAPLVAPGNAIFGALQEVTDSLRANPKTDWSKVDLEGLRQHLIDMYEFTLHVDVLSKVPVPNGVRFTVRPQNRRALLALKHVFAMHPRMLRMEEGWTMHVTRHDSLFTVTTTTPNPAQVPEIRALGYIGLLAAGSHHRRHHWMIATGMMSGSH